MLGAILAIPAAASIQIAVHEYREYRREVAAAEEEAGGPTPGSLRLRGRPRPPRRPSYRPATASGTSASEALSSARLRMSRRSR